MAKIIIANAFSINMLTGATALDFGPVVPEDDLTQTDIVRNIIDAVGVDNVTSIVGHPDTAKVIGNMLGIDIPCNRVSWTWPDDDDTILLITQLTGPRLPEGATTLPDGAKLTWWMVNKMMIDD